MCAARGGAGTWRPGGTLPPESARVRGRAERSDGGLSPSASSPQGRLAAPSAARPAAGPLCPSVGCGGMRGGGAPGSRERGSRPSPPCPAQTPRVPGQPGRAEGCGLKIGADITARTRAGLSGSSAGKQSEAGPALAFVLPATLGEARVGGCRGARSGGSSGLQPRSDPGRPSAPR